jgi:hypothetical protein
MHYFRLPAPVGERILRTLIKKAWIEIRESGECREIKLTVSDIDAAQSPLGRDKHAPKQQQRLVTSR